MSSVLQKSLRDLHLHKSVLGNLSKEELFQFQTIERLMKQGESLQPSSFSFFFRRKPASESKLCPNLNAQAIGNSKFLANMVASDTGEGLL